MLGIKAFPSTSNPGAPKAVGNSGLEMMLKSMGLGEVIEVAQKLASQGTIEKVLKFADGLEELNGRLARIEALLERPAGEYELDPDSDDSGPELPPAECAPQPPVKSGTKRGPALSD